MTEQQRIEELMKSRYKVIADYPGNTFDIGQILIQSSIVEDWLQTDNFLHGLKQSCVEKCKANFKRLEWWEDRKPEELRCIEYVKWVDTSAEGRMGFIEKVIEIESRGKENYFKVASQVNTIRMEYFKPATLAEYNQYINSNQ